MRSATLVVLGVTGGLWLAWSPHSFITVLVLWLLGWGVWKAVRDA